MIVAIASAMIVILFIVGTSGSGIILGAGITAVVPIIVEPIISLLIPGSLSFVEQMTAGCVLLGSTVVFVGILRISRVFRSRRKGRCSRRLVSASFLRLVATGAFVRIRRRKIFLFDRL